MQPCGRSRQRDTTASRRVASRNVRLLHAPFALASQPIFITVCMYINANRMTAPAAGAHSMGTQLGKPPHHRGHHDAIPSRRLTVPHDLGTCTANTCILMHRLQSSGALLQQHASRCRTTKLRRAQSFSEVLLHHRFHSH
jgi:hypothetical protein